MNGIVPIGLFACAWPGLPCQPNHCGSLGHTFTSRLCMCARIALIIWICASHCCARLCPIPHSHNFVDAAQQCTQTHNAFQPVCATLIQYIIIPGVIIIFIVFWNICVHAVHIAAYRKIRMFSHTHGSVCTGACTWACREWHLIFCNIFTAAAAALMSLRILLSNMRFICTKDSFDVLVVA